MGHELKTDEESIEYLWVMEYGILLYQFPFKAILPDPIYFFGTNRFETSTVPK